MNRFLCGRGCESYSTKKKQNKTKKKLLGCYFLKTRKQEQFDEVMVEDYNYKEQIQSKSIRSIDQVTNNILLDNKS